MTFNPLVSIIIPVYNGSDYLKEAIDSALAQTYSNCEVLVINDGSTDNGKTDEIAKSYTDRIRYISKKNGGVATALNMGIQEMRGEYFSWLSHDDLYTPNKVEAQVRFIEKFDLPDAIIYSNYETIDNKSKTLVKVELPEVAPEDMYFHLYVNQSIHGCSLLIPKKAFLEVGLFPEHLPTTQDYELWLAMARKYSFFRTAQILVKARQHAEQGSRKIKSHNGHVSDFYERHLVSILQHSSISNSELTSKNIQLTILSEIVSICFRKRFFKTGFEILLRGTQIIGITCMNPRLLKTIGHKTLLKYYSRLPAKIKSLVRSTRLKLVSKKGNLPSRLDFSNIYSDNGFSGSESVSGAGSTIFLTRVVRNELPSLFQKFSVQSVLDIPCGDFHWMKSVPMDSIQYTGGDVVKDLADYNQKNFGSSKRNFQHLNLITDQLPKVDLIFCRDCLVHLPFEDTIKTIRNIKKSGAKWLLTTTFVDRKENSDLTGITWRPINLERKPFNFPKPMYLMDEKCTEGGGLYGDKCLGLWSIQDLPDL